MGKRKPRSGNETAGDATLGPPPTGGSAGTGGTETTGRFMVVFKPGAQDAATVQNTLNKVAGLKDVATASDFSVASAAGAEEFSDADTMHFDLSGVVRVSAAAVQTLAASMASTADSPILVIEPELICYPAGWPSAASGALNPGAPGFPPLVGPAPGFPVPVPAVNLADYLRGFADGVGSLAERLAGGGAGGFGGVAGTADAGPSAVFADNAQFTWGLQATGVTTSPFSGQGAKVAVLDTGLDLNHIDFAGRAITPATFTGVPVQDTFGHGTHCIGTACGSRQPASGVRRYGIAYGAQIFAGRVFDNGQPRPSAAMGDIIRGIEWARANGCQIVSLSLGAPGVSAQFQQYHMPTLLALNAGCLVIAAAGNNARRSQGFMGVVEPPANADAVVAVAAVDSRLRIADFSGRSTRVGVNDLGGIVNISGPGVGVFSSVPGGHALFDGTSMATPHVAGIAALWFEATGDTGRALWNRLVTNVTPLTIPSVDCGAGLVRAPQSRT